MRGAGPSGLQQRGTSTVPQFKSMFEGVRVFFLYLSRHTRLPKGHGNDGAWKRGLAHNAFGSIIPDLTTQQRAKAWNSRRRNLRGVVRELCVQVPKACVEVPNSKTRLDRCTTDPDGYNLFYAVSGHRKAAAREDKVKARSSAISKGKAMCSGPTVDPGHP